MKNDFNYKWSKLFASKRYNTKNGIIKLTPEEQQELLDDSERVVKNCSTPLVRRSISLWMEGFAATGERQGASMIGTYEAVDLDDAVKQYMETHKGDVDWDSFGRGRHAIWACEIFDNEAEARKSFG